MNYVYVIFMAIWSTCYFESWKRKQAVVSFVWGMQDLKKVAIKRE